MRKFYKFYATISTDFEKVQQLVGQVPWGHHIAIITKTNSTKEAIFYINNG